MGLKTRIDGRSDNNNSFQLKDSKGKVLADIKMLGESSVTLQVSTKLGIYIEKPSGWKSKPDGGKNGNNN